MDLGRWLRSLGLERYEVAFRENAIDADVLRDLTDQDLEKIGVLLGDRRRLLRAIAELDETPSSATSPAPASSPGKSTSVSAAATSPTPAEVEASGERPNVVTLRANQTPLLKADVSNEGLALENAIRQVVTETGKSRTESRAEPRARPPSATPPAGPARPNRANAPPTNLPGEGWHDALLSARQRLLKGRSAAKEQAATSLRQEVVDEGHDLDATTVKAPQAAPPHDTYEPEAGAATEKVRQAARLPSDTYEPDPGTATAKAPQAVRPPRDTYDEAGAVTAKAPPARPPRDTYEPEAGAVTAKALRPARPPRDTYEPEAGAVTAKALRPARPQRDSHQPAVPAATAKGPQPARVPRDSYEPKAPTATTKAPQPARLPRDSYEPEPRAAPAKTPRAARSAARFIPAGGGRRDNQAAASCPCPARFI